MKSTEINVYSIFVLTIQKHPRDHSVSCSNFITAPVEFGRYDSIEGV